MAEPYHTAVVWLDRIMNDFANKGYHHKSHTWVPDEDKPLEITRGEFHDLLSCLRTLVKTLDIES